MEKTFGEILKEFKENESIANVIALNDSPQLRTALVAWQSVKITYKDANSRCTATSQLEKWAWLWTCCNVNLDDFSLIGGIVPYEANRVFERLKGLRLIYPDNTMSRFADQYLQTIILNQLPRARKPKAKKEE